MADPGEDEREEELSALTAIYPELIIDQDDPFSATLDIPVAPSKPLLIRFVPDAPTAKPVVLSVIPTSNGDNHTYAAVTATTNAHIEHDIHFTHLPTLRLQLTLPKGYPAEVALKVHLTSDHDWLPKEKVEELQKDAARLWEDYGRGQTAFVYIDHLQQAAENGFDLDQCADGLLVLSSTQEKALVQFDAQTKLAKFRQGTYDCGICLEPKKGDICHEMEKCGHVFCLECLHGYYENAIREGDVTNVTCLDPTCGKDATRKTKKKRLVHPRELLLMGISEDMVRRFVEMKRKKKIESDKNTVYCPRSWCQNPARSSKYPPIPENLAQYIADEESSGDEEAPVQPVKPAVKGPADPTDRLCICEKCKYAFCKVCFAGWHGPFQRCYPRDPNELSAEEKASYEFILQNTTPCPTCGSPVEKSHGCNHMTCFQCRHHFCYLCSSWLDPANPYKHFNTPGRECFQRLFELEEGDEGQGPGDGRGFGGGRRYEQMAIEAAREAEEAEARARAEADAQARAEEAELAAVNAQISEIELADAAEEEDAAGEEPANFDDMPELIELPIPAHRPQNRQQPAPAQPANRQGRGGMRRRPMNAHPPAPGRAHAVRQHERVAGQGRRNHRPVLQDDEIQRFVQMAARDEEDGWDSDELGDDEGFVIR